MHQPEMGWDRRADCRRCRPQPWQGELRPALPGFPRPSASANAVRDDVTPTKSTQRIRRDGVRVDSCWSWWSSRWTSSWSCSSINSHWSAYSGSAASSSGSDTNISGPSQCSSWCCAGSPSSVSSACSASRRSSACWLLRIAPLFVDWLRRYRENYMSDSSPATKDLGAVFDAHVKAEFVDMDVAATMATMAPEPYLT